MELDILGKIVEDMEGQKGEIVLYQPEGAIKLEVRVEKETVWLTANQMALLFNRDEKTLRKHINNVFSEELERNNNTHFLRVDGVKQPVAFYNLDVIISVGYRVKSSNGVKFRRWANQVLKDYLLKGYSINNRMLGTGMQLESRLREQQIMMESHSSRLDSQDARLKVVEDHIDFFVNAARVPSCGIISPKTRFDGYVLIADLVKTAKKSVVFIDPYADISALKFAAMRAEGVTAKIYSARITHQFKEEAELHNRQHPGLELKNMREVHDRFLLVDDTVYHFGASFKDMGAGFSAYCVLNFITPSQVVDLIK